MIEVEVLTPEGEVFSGEVRQVSTRTAVGEIGILANHAPLLAALQPAELRLHVTDSETKRYAQAHGWLQVFGNHARLLVEEAIAPEDLDAASLKEQLADAEQRLAEAEEGSAAHGRAAQKRPRPGRSVPAIRSRDERRARSPRRAADRLRHLRAGGGHEAAGFVKGWLEARGIEAARDEVRGLPVLRAEVGPEDAPTVVLHGHLDVVPGLGGPVRAAGRGRPPLRARRLRHEGGAGGDAAHHRRDARPGAGAGAAGDRRRRGVRGGARARQRPPRRQRLPRRLRDHRRADRPAGLDRPGHRERRAKAAA